MLSQFDIKSGTKQYGNHIKNGTRKNEIPENEIESTYELFHSTQS